MMAVALCLFTMQQAIGQTITSNTVGTRDGFTHEFWKDDGGSGSMTLQGNGRFTCSWSGINNILFRTGLRPGSLNQVITYAGTLNSGGNAYLTLYGWTTNPLVEYYIVESWGSWRPPGGTRLGTVTTDGGTYDIFRTERVNQPSIEGTRTFPQFWSVRQSRRTSGTITFANHVAAWRNLGMNMGSLYEVSMCVEGFQSSGSGSITSLSMTTGSATPPPTTPSPSGSNTIVVRARGVAGSEQIRLRVGNTTVATWTLTTSMVNRSVTTSATGSILVEFFNDATGRDVQIDNIVVNGTTRQAENMTHNTGVWQNNRCGGSRSEWLHCNGAIGFGDIITGRSAEVVMVEEGMYLISSPDQNNGQPGSLVFPNPAANVVNVSLEGDHSGEVSIKVFNALGALVKSIDNAPQLTQIDVSSLKSGIFFIQVRSNGHISSHRFVKE